MALKNESSNEGRTYIDIIVGNAQDWPTEVKPYFHDSETDVKTSNIKGKLISARGSMTPWSRGVKSITLVVVDKDGDELHINGSITQGTKDLFNQALANIGKDVALGVYLNKNGYSTGSVRVNDKFVEDTLFPYNEIDLDKMWSYVEDELGYFDTKEKTFIKAKNAPADEADAPVKKAPANKKADKVEAVAEEISIEDLPF